MKLFRIANFVFIQGKVDVSAHVRIHRSRRHKDEGLHSQEELDYFLPLEVKTGKMFSKLGKAVLMINMFSLLSICGDWNVRFLIQSGS